MGNEETTVQIPAGNLASGGFYLPQAIQSSGTMNVYCAPIGMAPTPPVSEPELGPLDWLRGEVEEVCALALAA